MLLALISLWDPSQLCCHCTMSYVSYRKMTASSWVPLTAFLLLQYKQFLRDIQRHSKDLFHNQVSVWVLKRGRKACDVVGEVKWVLQFVCHYRQRPCQMKNQLAYVHTLSILLTWQASNIHFLEVFGLKDDHGQLASSGDISQREADITQFFLLLGKQRHCRGEKNSYLMQIYSITCSHHMRIHQRESCS